MDGGEDWLFRPILANLLRYENLLDLKYDLYDFVLANEALDVQAENQGRFNSWQKSKASKRAK